MAATLVAKGSRDTSPRDVGGEVGNWGSLKGQSMGSTIRPQWGPPQPPELLPRKPSQRLHPLHSWP